MHVSRKEKTKLENTMSSSENEQPGKAEEMPAEKIPWKSWLLSLPMLAAAYFAGVTLHRFGDFYPTLMDSAGSTLDLLLWLLGAIVLAALAGGVVAVLVRPLPVAIVTMGLSALVIFLAWGIDGWSALGAIAMLVTACGYVLSMEREMKMRVRFSPARVGRASFRLMTGLSLAACISLYVGAAEHIAENGIILPEEAWSSIAVGLDEYITLVVPSEFRGSELNGMRETFHVQLQETLRDVAEPYSAYVPVVYALFFFMFLSQLLWLAAWLVGVLQRLIFPLLQSLGFAELKHERVVAERLVPR